MGIHGLWKLLEPAGKDVTLESLENKILAIDVSLWLHQAQQGTSIGGNSANAHLLTLFHRISKLLFYRIKPVFVFDGVAPELKKKTINARNQRKQLAGDRAKEMRQQLLLSLAKSGAIKAVFQKDDTTKTVPEPNKTKRVNAREGLEEDLYNLPPLPASSVMPEEEHTSEDSWGSDEDDNLMSYCEMEELTEEKEVSGTKRKGGGGWKKWNRWVDPHEVDVQDKSFKALPVEVRREILTDLKEARKESSWGRLHRMPKNLDNFSSFQMSRLLHRRKVQEVWEDVEKELSTSDIRGASLGELEAILAEKGVDVTSGIGKRIASDENKGFILLSGLKNQNADNEADEKKNTDLSLLKPIKEEPEDDSVDSMGKATSKPLERTQPDKFTEEEVEEWVGKKRERRVSLSEPTLSESKLLSESDKVKDFVRVAIGSAEEGAEGFGGGDFESVAEWSDGDSQEGLSQREIMEMIKGQPRRNSKQGIETPREAGNENQSTVDSNQRKRVLGGEPGVIEESAMEAQEIDGKGMTQMQDVVIIKNASEKQEIDNKIGDCTGSLHFNLNRSDSSKIEQLVKDMEMKNKPIDAEMKEPDQLISERHFDLECEGELSQAERLRIINEKTTNQGTENEIFDKEIFCHAKIETSIQAAASTEKGKNVTLISESAASVEEVVIIEDKESGGLTQEEIMAIISNQPTNLTEDKIDYCDASTNSETEESDFLEVEGVVEEEDKMSIDAEVKEPCREDSARQLDPEVKVAKTKELEVVIDIDAESDESNDIFADVFEGDSPVKNAESVPHRSSLEDQKGDDKDSGDKSFKPDKVVGVIESKAESHKPGNESKGQPKETLAEEGKRGEPPETEMTEEERARLTLEMRKMEREANAGVTEKARLESQELLGLFGVPWVVAPFEAEAQCAFLECAAPNTSKFGSSSSIRKFLAEGTVTEDSDIWAFGASNVYRHVFDRRRIRVRVYSREEIHYKLGLNRARVVQLALLTGSDYTIGLPGVGTVTALEILAAFPGEKNPHAGSSSGTEVDDVISGLQHFADWWKRVEKKENDRTPIGHSYFDPAPAVAKTLQRRLCSCWKAARLKQPGTSLLPPGFPSRAVVQAYLEPSVDECRDTFTWLRPDEAALRSYAELHFGWTKDRTESILRPLFARLKLSDSKDRTQMSLHSYFSHIRTGSQPGDIECSNFGIRAQKALERIAGKNQDLILPQSENIKKGTSAEDKETNSQQGKKDRKGVAKQTNKTGNLSTLKSTFKTDRKLAKQKLGNIELPNVANASPIKETGFSSSLYSCDKIPQREKECASALQTKLKAIEVLRKSSMGRGKRGRESSSKQPKKKIKRAEVCLSESSDSD